MWLYRPESSPSVPGLAVLTSGSNSLSQAPPLSVTLSGTVTQQRLSWQGWRTRSWITLLFGTISDPSLCGATEEELMLLRAESPANPTLQLACNSGLTMEETSGQIHFDFSLSSEPAPSSSKTSPASPQTPTGCQESFNNLPKWGSMLDGVCSAAEPFVPLTSEKDSSSWPTPTALSSGSNRGGGSGRVGSIRPSLRTLGKRFPTPTANNCNRPNGRMGESLSEIGKNWPTPRVNQSQGGDRQKNGTITPNLKSVATKWGTPTAQDWHKSGDGRKGPSLADQAFGHPVQTQMFGQQEESTNVYGQEYRLSPTFVEWLQGLPHGWSRPTSLEPTAYEAWETSLLQLSSMWLSESSSAECFEVTEWA